MNEGNRKGVSVLVKARGVKFGLKIEVLVEFMEIGFQEK